MIDTLNASWRVPLVETVKGGARHGGSTLTPTGEAVLRRYRALQAALSGAARRHGADLLALAGSPRVKR
jgi:molybdate transport system regulatory protein